MTSNWERAELLLPAYLFKSSTDRLEAVKRVADAFGRDSDHHQTMVRLERIATRFEERAAAGRRIFQ